MRQAARRQMQPIQTCESCTLQYVVSGFSRTTESPPEGGDYDRDSVERPAPFPAVGRPGDGAHPQPVIFRVAARVSGDDHVVAGLQRFARHALPIELQAGAPLDGEAHGVALRVLALDVDER